MRTNDTIDKKRSSRRSRTEQEAGGAVRSGRTTEAHGRAVAEAIEAQGAAYTREASEEKRRDFAQEMVIELSLAALACPFRAVDAVLLAAAFSWTTQVK